MDSKIFEKYPFLKKSHTVEDYVPPEEYARLLKPYVFSGLQDLEIFKNYLNKVNRVNTVLELCAGSGRASEIAIKALPNAKFILNDLSPQMLDYTKKKFQKHDNVTYQRSDAVEALGNFTEHFDLVYTLWGFSHSVHQHMHQKGFSGAKEIVTHKIEHFIEKNLNVGGYFYLVHFDSMSDEQRILMRQWKRVYPTFSNISIQSPSKLLLDEIFHNLDNSNKIILTEKHLIGDPIFYENEETLLEIFLNFHLETYFNQTPLLKKVIDDIKQGAAPYKNRDGSFTIPTGCYVYEIKKR